MNRSGPAPSSTGTSRILLRGPNPGTTVHAYVTLPRTGKGPVLLLLTSEGTHESALPWCRRFSDEGYVAVAPNLDAYRQWQAAQEHDGSAHNALLQAARAISGAPPAAGSALGVIALEGCAALALAIAADAAVAALALYVSENEFRSLATGFACPGAAHLACAVLPADLADLRNSPAHSELAVYAYPRTGAHFADPTHKDWDAHASATAHSRTLAVFRPVLGPRYDLARLFQEHLAQEFVHKDADATMQTMVDEPYVNHVPTLTGGYGHDLLKRFYKYHFIPTAGRDREVTLISESVGADTVVLEMVLAFTHDAYNDYLLPGVAPTGKEVHFPCVIVAKFRGDKLYREHIYWDQATVLVQLGLLNPAGLPVCGSKQAQKMLDPSSPSNELMRNWNDSEGKPI